MNVYVVVLRGVREHGMADDIEEVHLNRENANKTAEYLRLCGITVDIEEFKVVE